MKNAAVWSVVVVLALGAFAAPAQAQQDAVAKIYPAALFPFEERGSAVRDYGNKIADLLFAKLIVRPDIVLVDRTDLKKILEELELNVSGAVKANEANQIGQMTGAKILISGSVIQVDKKVYLVARIVGTETSRILGASVDGNATDELGPLVDKLADKVAEVITRQGDKLVAKAVAKNDRVNDLKEKIKAKNFPTLMIKIAERHVGMATVDPAAQTEMMKIAREVGFPVIDPESGVEGQADIVISGEGFSEFASRKGALIAVKARVELKVVDRRSGKVLAADRQTALVVELTEQIASKSALEQAAATLAERTLPKLVKSVDE